MPARNSDGLPRERVLGVQWCVEPKVQNHFGRLTFDIDMGSSFSHGILSAVNSDYDPLLAPVIWLLRRFCKNYVEERLDGMMHYLM